MQLQEIIWRDDLVFPSDILKNKSHQTVDLDATNTWTTSAPTGSPMGAPSCPCTALIHSSTSGNQACFLNCNVSSVKSAQS